MENNNLEFREGQSEMACEIVDAISQKKNLVVEAGVGIGKSFAYLVPLIYYNYYLQKPVVIATSTITCKNNYKVIYAISWRNYKYFQKFYWLKV